MFRKSIQSNSSLSCSALAFIVALALSTTAYSMPTYTKDVFCSTEKLGTMKITTYGNENKLNLGFDSKYWVGRVEIKGTFDIVKPRVYHYVQSMKRESDNFRWINDNSVALPKPYLDTPPGGYKVRDSSGGTTFSDQKFDCFPWYDEPGDPVPFPGFSDKPSDFLLDAKTQADKKLQTSFETWLICVIDDKHDNDHQAKDDTYKVGPLLGWKWGFDILYNDIGIIGTDEPQDFTVTKSSFSWVTTPSTYWTSALSAKYGKAPNQDWWNITAGKCEDCIIPDPASLTLALIGVGTVGWLRRRRKL